MILGICKCYLKNIDDKVVHRNSSKRRIILSMDFLIIFSLFIFVRFSPYIFLRNHKNEKDRCYIRSMVSVQIVSNLSLLCHYCVTIVSDIVSHKNKQKKRKRTHTHTHCDTFCTGNILLVRRKSYNKRGLRFSIDILTTYLLHFSPVN